MTASALGFSVECALGGAVVTPPASILLPGLDGTGELFERFTAVAPATFPVRALALPTDRARDYSELAEWVQEQLPPEPVALVAESFSGPIALMVANRCPRIVAVVLCATFVEPPLSRWFAGLSRFVPTRRPPTLVLALLLTGGDRGLARAVRQALDRVPARLVSSRIQNAVRVDARVELERLSQPLLWLHAKQDRLIRFPSAEAIRALKPAARVVEVDGPHLLLQANPAEAWRHIAPFLESASNGRAQVRR